jgi:hypothetical protein
MVEDKFKFDFHGKEMNLFGARLYLLGLELKVYGMNLNEKEKEDYLDWKKYKEEENEERRAIIKNKGLEKLTERQYLIEELESQIRLTRNAKKKVYCEKHGHKEMKGSAKIKPYLGGARVDIFCARCNALYERKPTPKELEEAKKKIYNPFQV